MNPEYRERAELSQNTWLNDRQWDVVAEMLFPMSSQSERQEHIRQYKENSEVMIRANESAHAIANTDIRSEEEVARREEQSLKALAMFLKERKE